MPFKKGNIPWNKGKKCPQLSANNKKHGMRNTKFYAAWHSMVNRCKFNNHYIQKKIHVCDRWKDFKNFMDDMYPSYLEHKKNHDSTTLDRIDNDGNYSPDNCRWVTKSMQNKNKSDTIKLKVNGKEICLSDIARRYNVKYVTLYTRIKKYGYSLNKALTAKNINERRARKVKKISMDGNVLKTYNSIKEAADDCGVDITAIWKACQSPNRSSAGYYWEYVERKV